MENLEQIYAVALAIILLDEAPQRTLTSNALVAALEARASIEDRAIDLSDTENSIKTHILSGTFPPDNIIPKTAIKTLPYIDVYGVDDSAYQYELKIALASTKSGEKNPLSFFHNGELPT